MSFPFRVSWVLSESVTNSLSVDEDARPLAAKYLVKWRPGFIESQTRGSASDAAPANAMAVAT